MSFSGSKSIYYVFKNITLINRKFLQSGYIGHFRGDRFSCSDAVDCRDACKRKSFAADLHRPIFPTCYMCYLSSHTSHDVTKNLLATIPSLLHASQLLQFPVSVNDGCQETNLLTLCNCCYCAQQIISKY